MPRELAGKLHEPLRRHFRDDPGVEVIVERRGRLRRGPEERRAIAAPAEWEERDSEIEKRRIRNTGGRRVADRRAPLVQVDPPQELPRRLRRYAEQVSFAERVEPASEALEDIDTARLVTRIQSGERDAFADLYTRYFDRVYGYLRIVLRDQHESEDAAQEVFTQVLEALPKYERRGQPFRAWLFTIVKNHALARLRKDKRFELTEPDVLERKQEASDEQRIELPSLNWISDRDLFLFIERLPTAQRQVLVLRYMLDFDMKQIGAVLDRSAEDVRIIHHRAVQFLRERLTAVGRVPKRGGRVGVRRRRPQSGVLRLRRFALH